VSRDDYIEILKQKRLIVPEEQAGAEPDGEESLGKRRKPR